MNYRQSLADLESQKIGLDRDGLICERSDEIVCMRRPGLTAQHVVVYRQADQGERRLGLLDKRVVEVAGPGTWPGLAHALKAMRSALPLEAWRIALFEQCGELFVEAAQASDGDGEVVCACKGTTRGDLRALGATCVDRAEIGRACGAGMVCGGCGPLIDEFVGQGSMLATELLGVERLDRDVALFRFRYIPDVVLTEVPGSHVLLQALVGGRWVTRPYTLVSALDGCVEIIVKRETGGLFSRWLHDHASAEAVFRLSLPEGKTAAVRPGRTLFIAAGVGITPAFLRISPNDAGALRIHWSVRSARSAGLIETVRAALRSAAHEITIHDTGSAGRASSWGTLFPPESAETAVVCGGASFQEAVVSDLVAAGWRRECVVFESFGQGRRDPPRLQHVDSFDYLQDPIVADSFHLAPVTALRDEAYAFLRQFYFEHGAPAAFEARWASVSAAIEAHGTYTHTYEELAFGARLAWRNSARCIGRFFWKALRVRDCRHLSTEAEMFAAIVSHLETATNGGDITPVITVFPSGEPRIRILNPQLVLYAGYRQDDGSVVGDPKNADLTEIARRLGWIGAGTRFDILPIMIQLGDAVPKLFELPRRAVLEVELTHPRNPGFARLGLRWFAVPAVSGMALDVGGIQFTAAPSNGFYMGTEIGSVNLADPSRYDELERVGHVMGYDATGGDPLWRDQAMLDLNVAVLHSFAKAGVRILDHHTLSDFFVKFREAEASAKRPSYGHWAWVMPPMGGNLLPVWRDNTLQKKILKPNYFYQPGFAPDRAAWSEAHVAAPQPAAGSGPSGSCPSRRPLHVRTIMAGERQTACSRRLDA